MLSIGSQTNILLRQIKLGKAKEQIDELNILKDELKHYLKLSAKELSNLMEENLNNLLGFINNNLHEKQNSLVCILEKQG